MMWISESPWGLFFEREGARWREFENGIVVSAPDGAEISFDEELTDVTTGISSTSFVIEAGDGRIFTR